MPSNESKVKYGEAFENICTECSKPFVHEDKNATLCPECWEKFVDTYFHGEGEGEGEGEGK